MKKINLNQKTKIIITTAIIIIMIAVIVMLMISSKTREKENSIFSVSKIVLYNSAGVTNNSNNPSLTNLSINQFSDLSIYINNSLENSELNNSNTIKELYIDNISIATNDSNSDNQTLNYKNSLSLGKYINLDNPDKNRIKFDIIKTNSQNSTSNYDTPTFYTDCSNPITLGYINKNIIQNYSISNNTNIVSYNAKVLKNTNIDLDKITCNLKFTIHIVNNAGHKLSCNVKLDITFDEDFVNNGYSYISIPVSGDEYRFRRN